MDKRASWQAIAQQLARDLEKALGDDAAETAALQKAYDACVAAGEGPPSEMMIPEFLAQEGSVENPPALECVEGATEDDIFRWSEKLADIAGY